MKRSCQLASQTDGTLYFEHLSACRCMHACMCECCICVSLWPSLHQQTFIGALRNRLWSDLKGAISQSNTALPEEEWDHGIERGDSIQQARFWMTETANDCLLAVWTHNSPFLSNSTDQRILTHPLKSNSNFLLILPDFTYFNVVGAQTISDQSIVSITGASVSLLRFSGWQRSGLLLLLCHFWL